MSLFPREPSGKAVSVFFIGDGAQGESPWSCGGVMGGLGSRNEEHRGKRPLKGAWMCGEYKKT